jgi:hypothetical protein
MHGDICVQAMTMLSVLYVPGPHSVQRRSACIEPAALTYWPGEHTLQGAHAAAFFVALNVPAEQALHTRSAIGDPGPAAYWPMPHSLVGTHGLAGLLS